MHFVGVEPGIDLNGCFKGTRLEQSPGRSVKLTHMGHLESRLQVITNGIGKEYDVEIIIDHPLN